MDLYEVKEVCVEISKKNRLPDIFALLQPFDKQLYCIQVRFRIFFSNHLPFLFS